MDCRCPGFASFLATLGFQRHGRRRHVLTVTHPGISPAMSKRSSSSEVRRRGPDVAFNPEDRQVSVPGDDTQAATATQTVTIDMAPMLPT